MDTNTTWPTRSESEEPIRLDEVPAILQRAGARLNVLCQIPPGTLTSLTPGTWSCSISEDKRGHKNFGKSADGFGRTPEAALRDALSKYIQPREVRRKSEIGLDLDLDDLELDI